ncbi:Pycsar system effector family protein [Amycolatopsis sp. NPDC049159]|uniref:Pycsar system effector family protein n=1 Tax=Amycolatopsis sp. NPDC049159 TaxID=3157210 RepID=UPI0034027A4E
MCTTTCGARCVLLAIWTVVPRAKWLKTRSIAHYGTIAAFTSAGDYRTAAQAILGDPDRLAENLAQHIWALSKAAHRKYRFVTWAMLAGAVGLILA